MKVKVGKQFKEDVDAVYAIVKKGNDAFLLMSGDEDEVDELRVAALFEIDDRLEERGMGKEERIHTFVGAVVIQ